MIQSGYLGVISWDTEKLHLHKVISAIKIFKNSTKEFMLSDCSVPLKNESFMGTIASSCEI